MVNANASQMSLVFVAINVRLVSTGTPVVKGVSNVTATYKAQLMERATQLAIATAYLGAALVVCVVMNAYLGTTVLMQEGMPLLQLQCVIILGALRSQELFWYLL